MRAAALFPGKGQAEDRHQRRKAERQHSDGAGAEPAEAERGDSHRREHQQQERIGEPAGGRDQRGELNRIKAELQHRFPAMGQALGLESKGQEHVQPG